MRDRYQVTLQYYLAIIAKYTWVIVKPAQNLQTTRGISAMGSCTPKHLFSNPKVALHPKKENTSPIFSIWLPMSPV